MVILNIVTDAEAKEVRGILTDCGYKLKGGITYFDPNDHPGLPSPVHVMSAGDRFIGNYMKMNGDIIKEPRTRIFSDGFFGWGLIIGLEEKLDELGNLRPDDLGLNISSSSVGSKLEQDFSNFAEELKKRGYKVHEYKQDI